MPKRPPGIYREAVLELSSIGSDRGAAAAWFELGALLDELGLEREAHDAYRSAAASTGLRRATRGRLLTLDVSKSVDG